MRTISSQSFRRPSSFIARAFLSANTLLHHILPSENVIKWNTLISEHARAGQGEQALKFYSQMREEGILANAYTFVAALKACSTIANLEAGKEIHSHLIQSGHENDLFVANTMLDMYAKCRSIQDACLVFEKMRYKNVVSWTVMILGYANMGMGDLALQLYASMQYEGIAPNDRAFVAALKACSSLAAQAEGKGVDGELLKQSCLEQGRLIHAEVVIRGLESDIFVANTLMDMYIKSGSIEDARMVFEKMSHLNVVSWTAMIMGYAQMEMGHSALELYTRMQQQGFAPNNRTFVAVLKACGSLAAQEGKRADGKLLTTSYLEKGRAIHTELSKRGFESDRFVSNTLVDMYAKCGSIEDAFQVFENMICRDVVSWNAIIAGYVQMEMGGLALELYARMKNEGFAPNSRTFVAVLKVFCILAAQEEGKGADGELLKASYLEQGKAVHAELAKRGFESDLFVASTLVDMYAKCGSMKDASRIFEKMRHRDVVTWTAMIAGYTQMEMAELALKLFARMQHEGFTPNAHTFVAALKACSILVAQEEGNGVDGKGLKTNYLEHGRSIHTELAKREYESDIFIANTLIDMYAKCRSIENAREVFEKLINKDVVSWNAMILGYAQMERGDLALGLYDRMQQEGFTPDAHTFVAALKACGSLASLDAGKEVHSQIQRAGLQGQPFIATGLIDMYGKCGSMEDAQQFFDSFPARNSVTFTALIAGYSGQGDSKHTFDLYKKMQQEGINPDSITFVSILSVCSHDGLVEKGQTYFQTMCLEYGICPSTKHYRCMADLLGRAGELDEAVAMVKMLFIPDIVTWITILGACRKWSNVETGGNAFKCLMMLDEKVTAAYVLMANICDSAQMWEKSARIQEIRTKYRPWKNLEDCK